MSPTPALEDSPPPEPTAAVAFAGHTPMMQQYLHEDEIWSFRKSYSGSYAGVAREYLRSFVGPLEVVPD